MLLSISEFHDDCPEASSLRDGDRNRRIIGPTTNMRRQCLGDRDFEERRRRAGHDDARYDLRRTSSPEKSEHTHEITHLFHQGSLAFSLCKLLWLKAATAPATAVFVLCGFPQAPSSCPPEQQEAFRSETYRQYRHHFTCSPQMTGGPSTETRQLGEDES